MTTILPPSIQEPTSAQSTPGLEFPGAFPREHTTTTRQPPPSDSHRASDRPQPISLPSSEKEGTHPGEHCGGVGPLPGNISETSVAKLPDERATESKAASAPSSRSKEIFADTDHGDDTREAVATAVPPVNPLPAPFVAPFTVKLPDERASKGEATSESASRPKELAADTDRGDDPSDAAATAVAPTSLPAAPAVDSSGPFAAKVPEERASEGEAASESASRSKELAADTGRGGDAREVVPAAVGSFGTPGTIDQDIPVRKTDPQVAVGEQAPEQQRTESSGTTDVTTPADSKFKEELRKEEKSGGVFDEGLRSPPQPPPPSHVSAAGDLALPKGAEEDSNKAAPAQQQQQSEIVGGPAGPRKGRSSSDSDASNHGKASIMNRVKGEVKVLLGKASGNKEKVEAGERMKQGTQ